MINNEEKNLDDKEKNLDDEEIYMPADKILEIAVTNGFITINNE